MRWFVVGVVTVALAMACGGSDAEPKATVGPSATVTATAAGTPSATATGAASATPTPWDDFVDVVEGDPVPLPEGVVVYYYGYVFLEGIPVDRWLRAHQTSEGLAIRDLAPDVPENSNGGYQFLDDAATGYLSARLCVQGYCGGHADPSPDAREETHQSLDGGSTWSVAEALPPDVHLAGTIADGRTLGFRYDPATDEREWFLWPSMESIDPPASRAFARMMDGQLFWALCPDAHPNPGCTYYHENHEVAAEPLQIPETLGSHSADRGEVVDLATWIPWGSGGDAARYVSEVAPDGSILRTVRWQGFDVRPIGWLDADRVVVLRFYPRETSIGSAYIVNFETGEMNEIAGLRPTDQDRDSYVTDVMTGEFAMVEAPGSCLHVRAAAASDSESFECFADGVLFEVTGAPVMDATGGEWLPVRAPGAMEGYASTEFLVR